jgi:hypothetical protein
VFDKTDEKISEDYLNILYQFSEKTENKEKIYNFYVKDNSIYIKYDLLKS